MKLIYTLFFLFFTLKSFSQTAFKAITYNIKWNDIMVDLDSWDDRKDAMLVFFQDEDADFLGLQEVMEDQLYFIKSGLEYYEAIGVGRDDGKMKGEYCPILYNTKNWALLKSKTIWLSETPEVASKGWDAASNRLITHGLFFNLMTGDSLAVFNTHFDHVGNKARNNSVEILTDFVKARSEGQAAIVLGDFNLEPRDDLYYALTDDFWDARMKAYSIHEDHEGTYNGFNIKGSHEKRIDYVFYKGNLDPISYECPDIRIYGRHVSDHFPVIVIMEMLSDD